jgi:Mn2+/Fe2+ NRAMP family transporter
LGISLAIRMIPKNIFEENKQKAVTEKINIKTKWIIVITIICIWALLIYLVLKLIFHK